MGGELTKFIVLFSIFKIARPPKFAEMARHIEAGSHSRHQTAVIPCNHRTTPAESEFMT